MKIDLERMLRQMARSRADGSAPVDLRVTSGATLVVHSNFDEIVDLHESEGFTWTEVTFELGKQGARPEGIGDAADVLVDAVAPSDVGGKGISSSMLCDTG